MRYVLSYTLMLYILNIFSTNHSQIENPTN